VDRLRHSEGRLCDVGVTIRASQNRQAIGTHNCRERDHAVILAADTHDTMTPLPSAIAATMPAPVPDDIQEARVRIRAEFVEMPGLKLTSMQVARLCAIDAATCDAALAALIDARFLVRTRDAFARL
jgi:hypothetical protein